MKKNVSDFKKLIQAKLKEMGKTQKELADALETSESGLSHLLSRGTTDQETMKIISKFLNFDINMANKDSYIKSNQNAIQKVEKDCQEQLEYLKELIKVKEDLIRSKDETIAALRMGMNK